MASPPADYYISSDYSPYDDSADTQQQQLTLNDRILVAVIVVLFCAIVFLSSLHIYGKWLRRLHSRNSHRQHILQLQNQAHIGPVTAMRNPGLSKAAIAVLPTFTHTAPTTNVKENASSLECAICLSEFRESEKGRMLPVCEHSFHTECIDMWFYSHSTCPLCRAPVMPTITAPPLIPAGILSTNDQQEIQEEEDTMISPHEIQIAIVTPSAHDSNLDAPVAAAAIHLNNLVCENVTQICTDVSLSGGSRHFTSYLGCTQKKEKPSSSSAFGKSTKRCVPQITIEIPTSEEDIKLTSPGCLSLPGRRMRYTPDQGCLLMQQHSMYP